MQKNTATTLATLAGTGMPVVDAPVTALRRNNVLSSEVSVHGDSPWD